MIKSLMIIESPTKITSYNSYINGNKSKEICALFEVDSPDEIEITASNGHFKGLDYNKTKGFKITNDNVTEYWDYISPAKKQWVEANLIPKLKQAQNIFLATDNDSAGEGISNEIISLLSESEWKNKNRYRIRVTEISESGLIKALTNKSKKLDDGLLNSEIARTTIDLELGFTVSTLLREELKKSVNRITDLEQKAKEIAWIRNNKEALLHLGSGRLKAFILEQIRYRREQVLNYKERFWYTINPIINEITFNQYATNFDFAILQSNDVIYQSLPDVIKALKSIKNQVKVDNISEIKHSVSSRFAPTILSDIPVNLFSNGNDSLLKVAQLCYDSHLTTYLRTEYRNISPDYIDIAKQFIENFLKQASIKDTNLPSQVWYEKPENKYISGSVENNLLILKKEKMTKKEQEEKLKEAQESGSLAAHECYRVIDLKINDYTALLMIIEELKETQQLDLASYNDLKNIFTSSKNSIISNHNLSEVLSDMQPSSKYYKWCILLNDCLNLYHYLWLQTIKIFLNAPEFDKAQIEISSVALPSEKFKNNLSEKTILGYSWLDIDYEKELINANFTLNKILSSFETNKTYSISNYNPQIESITNDKMLDSFQNSIIKKRTTKKPNYITESEILSILEKNSIGTPATRGTTLKVVASAERGLVNKIRKNSTILLDLTDFGIVVAELSYSKCYMITQPEWTANFDKHLKEIETAYNTNESIKIKNQMIINLVENELNVAPYKEYNWYYWNDSNQAPWPKSARQETDLHCPLCDAIMKTNGSFIFCDNENCLLPYDAKYKMVWGFKKDSIVPNKFCPTHPTLNLVISKNNKEYCALDFAIMLSKNEELIATLPKTEYVKKEITQSDIHCPSCDALMVQNEDRVWCNNEKCKIKYNQTYKMSWGWKKANETNTFCLNHPQIPMIKGKKGDYCPYEFALKMSNPKTKFAKKKTSNLLSD